MTFLNCGKVSQSAVCQSWSGPRIVSARTEALAPTAPSSPLSRPRHTTSPRSELIDCITYDDANGTLNAIINKVLFFWFLDSCIKCYKLLVQIVLMFFLLCSKVCLESQMLH